jgi:ribosomal RNA assembly protein
VIGTEGSIKKEIEEMADCYISVYGDTIGIIAPPDSMPMASEAISMLINGAMHSSVLNFLSRKKEELTLSRLRGHREVR